MAETSAKKPEGKRSPTRSLRSLRNKLATLVVSSGLMSSTIKPYFSSGCQVAEYSHQPGKRDARSSSTDNSMASVSVENRKLHDTLKINRKCVSSSIERNIELNGESDIIRVNFEDGSSLKVELEPGSIRLIYQTGKNHAPIEPTMDSFTKILKDCTIVEISYTSANGKGRKKIEKDFVSYDEPYIGQRLTFTRSDGVQLVLGLSPDAIKGINFTEK